MLERAAAFRWNGQLLKRKKRRCRRLCRDRKSGSRATPLSCRLRRRVWKRCGSELLRLAAETASLGNLRDEIQQNGKTSRASQERLERERSGHTKQLTQSQSRVQESKRGVEQKRAEMAQLRRQLQEQKEKKEHLEKQAETTKAQISEVETQLIAFRERLQSLGEIELRHSQYRQGSSTVPQRETGRSGQRHFGGLCGDQPGIRSEWLRVSGQGNWNRSLSILWMKQCGRFRRSKRSKPANALS